MRNRSWGSLLSDLAQRIGGKYRASQAPCKAAASIYALTQIECD